MKKNINKSIEKEGRKSKERKNKLTGCIIAIVVLALVYFVAIYAEREYVNSDIDTEVYVTRDAIEKEYTFVDESNFDDLFVSKMVRSSNLPYNAVINKEDIINNYITRKYTGNEVMSSDFLNDFADEYASTIANPIYVSASVSTLANAVSGTITKGDFIDILVFDTDVVTKESYICRKYKNVRVVEAFTADGGSEDEKSVNMLFTVMIDEKDEDKMSLDLKNGSIRINKKQPESGGYRVIQY